MFSTPSNTYNINKSHELPQCPSDGISQLAWFPVTQNNQTLLAAASWDRTVRIWDVRFDQNTNSPQSQSKSMFTLDAPVLCCTFSRQNALFTGSCDNLVRMHNIATNQTVAVGKHDAPVSSVHFDDDKNVCISGSWDKTVRFWDCRQQNPVFTANLNSKVYAMDYKAPILVAAGSDRIVSALSIDNLSAQPTKTETVLKMQLRTVSLFPSRKGFACGSIEGRCCITHLDESMKGDNFAFKCHRVEERPGTKVFPVNSVDFHPVVTSALVSSGSDGTITCWEIDVKQKLKGFENVKCPINCTKYDASGQLMAYAVSYDWHKGHSFSDPSKSCNKVLVHVVNEEMIKAKPSPNAKR